MSDHLTIETLLVAGISCVGAGTLRLLVPRLGAPLTIVLSGLVGVLVVSLSSVISIGLGEPNSLLYVGGLSGVLLACSFIAEYRRSHLNTFALSIGGAALAGALVTIGIGLLVHPILTFDSWRFLEHGSSVFGDGSSVHELLKRSLGNYPISLVSLQGLAQEVRIPFVASGAAAIGVMGVSGAFELFARPMDGVRQALRLFLIAAVVIGVGMSAYITRLQLGYVNAHAMTAGFYALGVAGVFAPGRESSPSSPVDESVRAAIIGISCAGLALGRVEGLLLAGFILVAAVTFRGWSQKSLAVIALVGIAVPVVWYARLATTLVDADILTPSTIVILILATSGPLLVAAFSAGRPVPWLASMTMLALGGATVIVALANPEGFGLSVSHLILNMISTGLWGAIWWVAIPLSVMAVWRIRMLNARASWLVVTLGFVLVVMILGGVRDFPYTARWGDSANRMMVHVAPAFFLLVFSGFGPVDRGTDVDVTEREAHEPTEPRR